MVHVYAARLPLGETGHQEQSRQARRLLETALQQVYPGVVAPLRVEKDELGRPCLPEYPQIFISFSHSGPYVACAFGEKPVGVDLEVWKTRRNLERVVEKLHPLEQKAYGEALDSEKEALFFAFWVQKESFLKALGCGLRRPLSCCALLPGEEKVRQEEREEAYYYRLYSWEEEPRFSLAVCSEEKEFPEAPIFLHFRESIRIPAIFSERER